MIHLELVNGVQLYPLSVAQGEIRSWSRCVGRNSVLYLRMSRLETTFKDYSLSAMRKEVFDRIGR
jgi:hypothetical protein